MDGIKKTNTDTEPYTGYVFPGTSSEEQDENDARFAAMNPSCFTNLQDNFICQLRLDKPLEFRKPVSINEQVF
ncbi:MAG: hypothetical protein LBI81_01915, partial [Puniceicoccales bacterium]|nr:hypothetical protein [Puniceicoccales bacterium]